DFGEPRNLDPAGAAPGSRAVQQDDFAAKVGELHNPAAGAREREVGSRLADRLGLQVRRSRPLGRGAGGQQQGGCQGGGVPSQSSKGTVKQGDSVPIISRSRPVRAGAGTTRAGRGGGGS